MAAIGGRCMQKPYAHRRGNLRAYHTNSKVYADGYLASNSVNVDNCGVGSARKTTPLPCRYVRLVCVDLCVVRDSRYQMDSSLEDWAFQRTTKQNASHTAYNYSNNLLKRTIDTRHCCDANSKNLIILLISYSE